MMEKGKMERGVVELVDTENLVPQEHLLRKRHLQGKSPDPYAACGR